MRTVEGMLAELEDYCGTLAGLRFFGCDAQVREYETFIDCLTRQLVLAGASRQSVDEFKHYADYCGAEDGGASNDWSEKGCEKFRKKILQEVKMA